MVSVIIPNYNHEQYIEKRINSVLFQTYSDFEVIILDDCSTDKSWEIISEFSNHPKVSHSVRNQNNSGSPFAQWEKGISLAKGEIIWIAESDDYADSHFLEKLVPKFDNEKIGIAFCSSFWIDKNGLPGNDLSMYEEDLELNGQIAYINHLVYGCIIQNASSALIRKKFIPPSISYLSKFRYCGDWLFYASVLLSSDLVYTNEKLNYFRWYHNNSSHKAIEQGKWTDEGLHILRFLPFSIYLSRGKMKEIFKLWDEKISNIPNAKRRATAKFYLYNYYGCSVISLILKRLGYGK